MFRAQLFGNISRRYVKKATKESYTKRGYRLLEEPDLLSPLAMKQILKTDVFGKRYVYMDVTESTNLEARRLAQQGAEEGTVLSYALM